jgi:metal-responsive CopG/Arc/MetJ family transcriptional regulator
MPSVSFSVQMDTATRLDTYIEKHGLRSRTHAIQKLLEIEKRHDLIEVNQ